MRHHVGLIPDGNRRWARARDLDPWEGHRIGAEKAQRFLEWCVDQDEIREITLYALSEENFGRPPGELEKLFELYENKLGELIRSDEINRSRLKIRVISTGAKPIPRSLMRLAREVCQTTQHNDGKVLNMLMGYTGQSEILQAVSTPGNRMRNLLFGLREADLVKGLKIKSVCDFIIRTGDEEQSREAKSGFLIWQSSYSEYYHIDKLFPDVTIDDFEQAWSHFKKAARKKGL